MEMESLFVELRPQYLERILAIERQVFSQPWTERDFSCIFQEEQALSLGLKAADRLVAYGMGHIDRTEFHLANLAVDQGHRNKGYAGRLVEELLVRARARGCTWCGLEVRISNGTAVQFYQESGFRQVGIRPRYYLRPRENALIMRRELAVNVQ
ncbi:MAG: ribosomal-protein-alanine N-acetyltransferase [Candidatus Latescibacteria bacterium]|nr:ribosomal-protein-alanine N-acetyltransferase [Candidatus Latescibacterota bacterium]